MARSPKTEAVKAGERARYQERKASGICVLCAKRPPNDGVIHCGECLAWRNESYYRRYVENGPIRLLKGVKTRAKKNGMAFDLDKQWLSERSKRCELTGIEFDYSRSEVNRCNPFGPSIDRIDCAKGYTKDNCRVVLYGMNAALNEWGTSVFKIMAQAYLSRAA